MLASNKHNHADVLKYLDGLTESQLLQNSALIYAMENTKTRDLINYIRFNENITLEQLQVEKEKVEKLQETAIVTESTQIDSLNDFYTVIESAIRRKTNMKCIVNEHMMHYLEEQLFDNYSDFEYRGSVLSTICREDANDTLSFEDSRDKITPCGLAKMIQLICDPSSPLYDSDETEKIKQCVIQKLRNTMQYEMNNDEYNDIPVVHAMKYTKDYMKDVYHGFEEIEDKIDDIFDEFEDELEDELEYYLQEEAIDAQFNPNPFNVYNLCPFPVGSRSVHRSLMDIAAAETDDELDSAIYEFTKINTYMQYVDEAASTDGPLHKGVRKTARASAKATDKVKKSNSKIGQLKKDISKIPEPMIKYIEDTIQKIKEADEEERRNIIIKGGVMPKVLRWVKRSIGLVIVGSFGSTGAIISAIGLLTMIATDSHLDGKARTKVLRELEDELQIVEEKIDDARGDSNKQKKYELIRIRNKLKTDTARITLRLRN